MVNHIKKWNRWRKRNINSHFYKLLVLLKLVKSPTFEMMPDKPYDDYFTF